MRVYVYLNGKLIGTGNKDDVPAFRRLLTLIHGEDAKIEFRDGVDITPKGVV